MLNGDGWYILGMRILKDYITYSGKTKKGGINPPFFARKIITNFSSF